MKRNPVAKNLRINRPKAVPAKKGKGSYKRKVAAVAFIAFTSYGGYAVAAQQQSSSRCYERCTTDVTGATHCVSWCQ